MRPDSSGLTKLDLKDPKDVQYLVDTGYAWKSGPKVTAGILRMLISGDVKRNPAKEPPEVTNYLNKAAPLPGVDPESPVEDAAEPMEEPGAPPA